MLIHHLPPLRTHHPSLETWLMTQFILVYYGVFFNQPSATGIDNLSLHDALPISKLVSKKTSPRSIDDDNAMGSMLIDEPEELGDRRSSPAEIVVYRDLQGNELPGVPSCEDSHAFLVRMPVAQELFDAI